jgi:hypothetical protein
MWLRILVTGDCAVPFQLLVITIIWYLEPVLNRIPVSMADREVGDLDRGKRGRSLETRTAERTIIG